MSLKAGVPLTERASKNWVGGSATVSAKVSKSRYIIHLGPPLGMPPGSSTTSRVTNIGTRSGFGPSERMYRMQGVPHFVGRGLLLLLLLCGHTAWGTTAVGIVRSEIGN
jgi:hypothetical protein